MRLHLLRWLSPARGTRLEGERLFLRLPEEGDWRAYAELRTASRRFLEPWEPAWLDDTLSRDAYLRRVRRGEQDWRDDASYAFFLVRRADLRLLGGIGLSNIRRGVSQSATLGYWIGQEFARQRYMTEALGLLLDHAFGPLRLHRIEAACLPHNEASRRLLLRAGFVEDGRARRFLKIGGEWHDHLLYALLAEDFAARRS